MNLFCLVVGHEPILETRRDDGTAKDSVLVCARCNCYLDAEYRKVDEPVVFTNLVLRKN